MSLRETHAVLERMRGNLIDQNTNANAKATFEQTVRTRWRAKTDELFQQIPNAAMPFALHHAWNVFDDRTTGVLEKFLIELAQSKQLEGLTIKIPKGQFTACGVKDIEGMMRIIYELNFAWQHSMRILVLHENPDIALIRFFAL